MKIFKKRSASSFIIISHFLYYSAAIQIFKWLSGYPNNSSLTLLAVKHEKIQKGSTNFILFPIPLYFSATIQIKKNGNAAIMIFKNQLFKQWNMEKS